MFFVLTTFWESHQGSTSGGEKSEFKWHKKGTWKITEINNNKKYLGSGAEAVLITLLHDLHKCATPEKYVMFTKSPASFLYLFIIWVTLHAHQTSFTAPVNREKWMLGELDPLGKIHKLQKQSFKIHRWKIQKSSNQRLGAWVSKKSSCCLTSVAGPARHGNSTVTQLTLPCPRISGRALGHHIKQRIHRGEKMKNIFHLQIPHKKIAS